MEPLEIKLEADSGGLQTQLKQASAMLNTFVNDMTGLHVDWSKILGGAIDAAVLAEVADMFAASISQSLNFAQQTADIGAQTGASVTQMGAIGAAALDISNKTGVGAQEVQSAISTLTPLLGGSFSAAVTAAGEAANLSAAGMGSIGDIVTAIIPVLQQFGITTSSGVLTAMNSIFQASETMGPGMFVPLTNSIESMLPTLIRGGTNISSFGNVVATLASSANVSGLTAATNEMQLLANAAAGIPSDTAVAQLAGGIDKLKSDLADGKTPEAMEAISKAVASMGSSGVNVQSVLGISPATVLGLQQYSDHFADIRTSVDDVVPKLPTIDQAFADLATPMLTISKGVNDMKNMFVGFSVPTAVSAVLGDFTSLFKLLGQVGIWSVFEAGMKDAVDGVTVIASGFQVVIASIGAAGVAIKDVLGGNLAAIPGDIAKEFDSLGGNTAAANSLAALKDISSNGTSVAQGAASSIGLNANGAGLGNSTTNAPTQNNTSKNINVASPVINISGSSSNSASAVVKSIEGSIYNAFMGILAIPGL